jgi:acetyl esterase
MATDYSKLIDKETWAFIERTNSYYPPDTVDYTIGQQRAIYDRMCREFFAGYPDGVTARGDAIDAGSHPIPIRIYTCAETKPRARILYIHGGGFVVGGLDSHDDICAELCVGTGCEVVSIGYRLAPEHPHPEAFDDVLDGFEWASAPGDLPVILCGDSAGGNLAAAVAHAKRDGPSRAAGQVLIYPALGGDSTRGSYIEHAQAPMLTLADVHYYETVRTGGAYAPSDPTLAPLADTDFSGLPPTVIFTAECDPLGKRR